jgi:hypothetical protein
MVSWLSSLSFGSPWGLLALPFGLGALLFVYRQQNNAKRLVVPSLFLLREFAAPAYARRRLFFPLRFFFELLLLFLLVAGIAAFSFQGVGKTRLFVLDNSFSMGAFTRSGITRLEQAKQDALLELSANHGGITRVFKTNPALVELTREGSSSAEVEDAIRSMEISFSGDLLEQAVRRLASSLPADEITLFSDRSYAQVSSAQDSFVKLQGVATQSVDGNVGFLDARVSHQDRSLTVTVVNTNKTELNLLLQIFTILVEGNAFPEVLLRQMVVSVAPDATKQVELGVLPAEMNYFRVALSVKDDVGANLHPDDDTVWLALEDKQLPIVVVTQKSLSELGLDTLRSYLFERVTPEQFAQNSFTRAAGYIFHRVVPPKLPPGSSLLIMPPSSDILEVRDMPGPAVVSSWTENHPLTRYVRFQDLTLQFLSVFEVPYWAQPLITTTKGTAGIVGTVGDVKAVALGFEVFPFQGKQAPLMSIFTLNLLSWLFAEEQSVSHLLVEHVRERVGVNGEISYLSTDEQTMGLDNNIEEFRPGLIRVNEQNSTKHYAINFFSGEESRVSEQSPLFLDKLDIVKTEKQQAKTSGLLSQELALLLLTLVTVDLIILSILSVLQRLRRSTS